MRRVSSSTQNRDFIYLLSKLNEHAWKICLATPLENARLPNKNESLLVKTLSTSTLHFFLYGGKFCFSLVSRMLATAINFTIVFNTGLNKIWLNKFYWVLYWDPQYYQIKMVSDALSRYLRNMFIMYCLSTSQSSKLSSFLPFLETEQWWCCWHAKIASWKCCI